jgi:hypothetical protein
VHFSAGGEIIEIHLLHSYWRFCPQSHHLCLCISLASSCEQFGMNSH